MIDRISVDVAIVGAGISGLCAAWELKKLGNQSFVVIEARSRIGGRMYNEQTTSPDGRNSYVEQGGTWAGPAHTEFLALAKELGIGTKSGQRIGGDFLFKFDKRWTTLESPNAFSTTEALDDFNQVLDKFEQLRCTLPCKPYPPMTIQNAEFLDSITMYEWIEQNTTTCKGKVSFAELVRQTIGGSLQEVSLLWMLHFFNTTNSFLGLNIDAEGIRFEGGSFMLPTKLAELLNDHILLDRPVQKILNYNNDSTTDNDVQIITDNGTITAKKVIVAMNPVDVRTIEFNPPLPSLHRQLLEEWKTMSWIKFYAFYDNPFWQSHTNGSHFLDATTGFDVYDVSPDDGSQGVIVGLISAKDYSHLSKEERKITCLKFLADEVCVDEKIWHPHTFTEIDWSDQKWTSGCVSTLPPGVFSKLGTDVLTEPVGNVYWAGTERSSVWTNYIEGAIRSGQQVVQQISLDS